MGSSCNGKMKKQDDVREDSLVQKESVSKMKRPPALNIKDKQVKRNSSINSINTGCTAGTQSKHSSEKAFDFQTHESTLAIKKVPQIKISISIGEGPHGKVFECLNQETGELCAIKTFDSKTFTQFKTKETERSIKQEQTEQTEEKSDSASSLIQTFGIFKIKNLAELRNINIIKYLWVDELNQQLIMQYMEGGSVKDLLNKFGKLDDKIVAKYIKQAFLGLRYLHKKQLIHGNLKCSNLLVDTKGNIKLCDFFNEQTCQDKNQQLQQQDIKLMGATLIEMLTGTFPNQVSNIDLQSLNQNWRDLISQCLDGTKRISQLLEHELLKKVQIPESKEKSTSPIALCNQKAL